MNRLAKDGEDSRGNGLFIVIEGADGSGKATQFNILTEKLRGAGHRVEVFDFPQYENGSSHFVKSYLNGEYGPASSINPYTASLFYALDRFEAAPRIRSALRSGKIVLSNRYVGSNMAHQGSKFSTEGEQRGFFLWEDGLEYQLLGIPRPTINLFLRVPAEISYKLISQKSERDYTKNSHDEHEADISHLIKSVKTYDLMAELFPKDFITIDCIKDDKLLGISEISKIVWAHVKLLLANPSKTGRISNNLPPKAPLQKVQSEKQVSGGELSIRLKNVSLLAAAAVEAGTDTLQKDIKFANSFDYHLPENTSDVTATEYIDAMEKLKKNYNLMCSSLEQYYKKHPLTSKHFEALYLAVPLSAYCNILISSNEENLRKLIAELASNPLPEIRQMAEKIEKISEGDGISLSGGVEPKNQPPPERVGTTIANIALERLPKSDASITDEIKMLKVLPRNEFDLIADPVQSSANLASGASKWNYHQKKDALEALLEKSAPAVLNNVAYEFEIEIDRITLSKLKAAKSISNLRIQPLEPRFGYKVHPLIEKAALEDVYHNSYKISAELFSRLQESGREEYLGYATLLGQKIKCRFDTSGRVLLHDSDDSDIQEILKKLRGKIYELHPMLSDFAKSRKVRSKNKTPAEVSTKHQRSAHKKQKKLK